MQCFTLHADHYTTLLVDTLNDPGHVLILKDETCFSITHKIVWIPRMFYISQAAPIKPGKHPCQGPDHVCCKFVLANLPARL